MCMDPHMYMSVIPRGGQKVGLKRVFDFGRGCIDNHARGGVGQNASSWTRVDVGGRDPLG